MENLEFIKNEMEKIEKTDLDFFPSVQFHYLGEKTKFLSITWQQFEIIKVILTSN